MSSAPPTKKILILAANPKDTSRLRLDDEVRAIKQRLRLAQGRDGFVVEAEWAVRTGDLQQALFDVAPQIVHFCGHGVGEAGLAFENGLGQAQLVSATALADLFKLFKAQVECVVLNAWQATAIAKHIPYVVGMQQAIGDQAAIAFADGFYGALGAGIYSDHLRRHWLNLQTYPALAAAMRQVVVKGNPVDLDADIAFKLESMGLITLKGNAATARCDLYRLYFRDHLRS